MNEEDANSQQASGSDVTPPTQVQRDSSVTKAARTPVNVALKQPEQSPRVSEFFRRWNEDRATSEDLVHRGIARYGQGDLPGAIGDFNEAIQLDPESAVAYNNRGIAHFKQGDLDAATQDHTRAIDLNPEYASAYNCRGNARAAHGDLDAAICDYDRAIYHNPRFASAYLNRGTAHAARGDAAAAIADYEQAIAINPLLAKAYHNRGNAYFARGDLDAAIDDYDQAIAIDPRLAKAYRNRGNARAMQGDLYAAIEDFDQAIAIDPQYSAAHDDYARVLFLLDNDRVSVKETSRDLQFGPPSQGPPPAPPETGPRQHITLIDVSRPDAVLSPEYLDTVVSPYLASLERLQHSIDRVHDRTPSTVRIYAIYQGSVGVDISGIGDAVRAVDEVVTPKKRRDAAKLRELEILRAEQKIAEGEVALRRAGAEADGVETDNEIRKQDAADTARLRDLEFQRIELDIEERKLAVLRAARDFAVSCFAEAARLVEQEKPELTGPEKLERISEVAIEIRNLTESSIRMISGSSGPSESHSLNPSQAQGIPVSLEYTHHMEPQSSPTGR